MKIKEVQNDSDINIEKITICAQNVDDYANIRQSYSINSDVVGYLQKYDDSALFTGKSFYYYDEDSNKTIALSSYWVQVLMPNGGIGYVRADKVKFGSCNAIQVSFDELNVLLEDVKNVNGAIYLLLLEIATLLNELKAKGINVSQYEQQFKVINNRLANRYTTVQKSSLINHTTKSGSSWSTAYSYYKSECATISGINKIGIAPIIIAAVVFAITAATAYLAWKTYRLWKPICTDSANDLVICKKLKKALESLSPTDRQEVIDDLQNQIDKSFNDGKIKGSISTSLSIIKPIAIGVIALFIINKLLDNKARNRILKK